MEIVNQSPLLESSRTRKVRTIFDLPEANRSTTRIDCPLPTGNPDEPSWSIGLIVGPSGSGKTTLLHAGFGPSWSPPPCQNLRCSVLDEFPEQMPIETITRLLSSVGFSSPPAWLCPRAALSQGQRWRVELALAAAQAMTKGGPMVLDEFTSVLDRNAAMIGCSAFGRTIRGNGLKFVAASCHNDIIDWLQPDWIAWPESGQLQWRSLWRRPKMEMRFHRCPQSLWSRFAQHHYLSGKIHHSSICFALLHPDAGPVAFSAWLPFMGAKVPTRREHRTVVLPDFQGIGLGNRISQLCASLFRGLGYRALSTTSHPALIQSRRCNPEWRLLRKQSICSLGKDKSGWIRHATKRMTAGFESLGEPMDRFLAQLVLGDLRRKR